MALYLTDEDVLHLVDMRDAIAAVEEAFLHWGRPGTANLPRGRLPMPNGQLNLMAAAVPWRNAFGYKSYFVLGQSRHYRVHIFCSQTGRLLALVDASTLGQLRTGAASGLATRLLAKPQARCLALIGSGRQARMQLRAIAAERALTSVRIYSPNVGRRNAFADAMGHELEIEITPTCDASSCVEGADIVVTATIAAEPVLLGSWLSAGVHVNAIGANAPHRRELDPDSVINAALVVVEDAEQARIEAAEIIDLARAGRIRWSEVIELGAIAQRLRQGRTGDDQITIFKSLGIALADVVFAHKIYEKAQEQRIGRTISDL